MMRNKFLFATAAMALALSASNALADGVTSCGNISQARSMLQKYAVNDPDNYCIRAMTLAESTPCLREEVIHEANRIGSKYNLAAVVVGCPGPVAAVVAPPPAPVVQYVQPQQQVMGYVYQQPAPPPPVMYQPVDRVAGTAIVQGDRFSGSHAGILMGSSLLWVGLGLLAAGGTAAALITGGTDGGTSTDDFITDEYKAQYSLTTMDAASAYRAGFTGDGITIALLDTGLDTSHSEFDGRVVSGGGYDFVTNNAGQPDASALNAHGTEVGGVMSANRNFVGMHGVAYNSTLMPLRVFDSSGAGIASFDAAIDYARNHGAMILNGSYGPDDAWHTTFETRGYQGITAADLVEGAAYLRYVNAGGILVFPAGNAHDLAPTLATNPTGPGFLPFIKPSNANIVSAAGGAYRDTSGNALDTTDFSGMQSQTIVVAGVDRNNNISSFSNRCGVAAQWCMVAPDENIFTTTVGGGYTTVSGTSFAAPQVAGAIAVLKQEFPNLSSAQIVARLLHNATDLGTPGVDAIYGWGLLNLAAASSVNGVASISTTGLVEGSHVTMESTGLKYGAAFGEGASLALADKKVIILDQDNAAFKTGISQMVNVSADRFDTEGAVNHFDREDSRQTFGIGDNTKLGFVVETNSSNDRHVGDKPKDPSDTSANLKSFSMTQSFTSATEASVHYRDSEALSLGFSEGDRSRFERAIMKDGLANPFAAFAGEGYASVVKTQGLGGTVKVAGFFGHNEADKDASNFGAQAELGYNLDKGADVYVSAGSLFEDNRVLGSKGSGALAFGNGTSTAYMGVGGKYALNENFSLRAAGYAGYTNPSLNADNSLIKDASGIITSSFNAGVDRAHAFQKGDSVGFTVSQPLRVESGNMQFAIPVALDASSNTLVSDNFTQDLSAKGREMDMELNYAFPVGSDGSKLSAGALYRLDAGHQAGKQDALGVMRWSKKF